MLDCWCCDDRTRPGDLTGPAGAAGDPDGIRLACARAVGRLERATREMPHAQDQRAPRAAAATGREGQPLGSERRARHWQRRNSAAALLLLVLPLHALLILDEAVSVVEMLRPEVGQRPLPLRTRDGRVSSPRRACRATAAAAAAARRALSIRPRATAAPCVAVVGGARGGRGARTSPPAQSKWL